MFKGAILVTSRCDSNGSLIWKIYTNLLILRKYNEVLAMRVAERLCELPNVEEKLMFDGLFFLVDGKICISVHQEEIMVRIDPNIMDELAGRSDWKQLTQGSKGIKGYVLVADNILEKDTELDYWIQLALEFNPHAKASPKKIKK